MALPIRKSDTMKLIKLSVMLVLALAMTFAATGCKKKPGMTTPLPGQRVGNPGNGSGPVTADTGGRFTPDNTLGNANPTTSTSGFPLDATWTRDQMNEDPSKFAAQTVHFAFDSSTVRSSEQVKVEAVAAAMQSEQGLYLIIEGHCDERGTEEYNRSLGEKRALALREELIKAGIASNRIRSLTMGEDKPVATGHDEASWSQNRRGVFIACTPK